MTASVKQFVVIFMACVLLPSGTTAFAIDHLLMPRELVEFGITTGCVPIDNFFDRPGMVNPPYVYGWLPGDQGKSAAFWCKNTGKSAKPYSLKFKVSDPKRMQGCPAAIDWSDFPGGLSVETRSHIALSDFHSIVSSQRTGPSVEVSNVKVLVNYYDGLSNTFYCYKGDWLVASTE